MKSTIVEARLCLDAHFASLKQKKSCYLVTENCDHQAVRHQACFKLWNDVKVNGE